MMLQTLPAEHVDQVATNGPTGHVRPQATDRRGGPRIPIDEAATVYILRPTAGERHPAQIIDISENGLGIQTSNLLLPGSLILVRARESLLIVGRLLYSHKSGHYFRSGIEVEFAEDCRK